jgi:hypothetical protein
MSTARLVLGPFNRVEGDLEVSLDVAEGRVARAEIKEDFARLQIRQLKHVLYHATGAWNKRSDKHQNPPKMVLSYVSVFFGLRSSGFPTFHAALSAQVKIFFFVI